MWTIAARELRSLLSSPLAWSILAVMQLISSWNFAKVVELFLRPDIQSRLANEPNAPGITMMIVSSLFSWIGIILLLVMPLLTMRLISEERRNKTLPLLLSAPVSMTGIIMGKFLGLMSFLLIMLAMLMLMPLSLLLGGHLDFGHLAAGLLGTILLLGALAAIGLYISTLTAHPTIAAISTFGVLLFLWMIDWAEYLEEQGGVLTYLSMMNHYQPLLEGIFSTEDVIYYILFITLFLILSIQRLDADRIQ
ncbi:ABC transporter permease [Thioploca ingrica]|uniref:ABC transporter permease n=1 Tax=Thioploca ingrica TaxID=40754 RepID=A0A090AM51_9GAMM|nr:ABC transporter permease [Thioploca ingrica]